MSRNGIQHLKCDKLQISSVQDPWGWLCAIRTEQKRMWLEHLAVLSRPVAAYPFPLREGTPDYRPLLAAIVVDRLRGRDVHQIAHAFHAAVADGIVAGCDALERLQVVASGGVFQNALLVAMLAEHFGDRVWLNAKVPTNDGAISLGQAAIAASAHA